MWVLGYSINNLTLMALTLAIGFLVDDAIVFLENVVRRAESGESIYKATLNSAGEISFTILSMTLSLAAVFIPLVFMPGLLGRIFREFAVTIIVAIFASGLGFADAHAADVRADAEGTRPGHSEDVDGTLHPEVLRADPELLQPLARLVSRSWLAGRAYPRALCALGFGFSSQRCRSPSCPPGTAASFADCFVMQEGTSPQQQREIQDKLDPILQANPAVDKYFTVAGSGRGGSSGIFTVLFLKDRRRNARRSSRSRWICARSLSQMPGRVPDPESAARSCRSTSARSGSSLWPLQLCPLAASTRRKSIRRGRCARREVARPTKASSRRRVPTCSATQPNIDIDIDRDRASLYGVSTTKLQNLLRAAYSQNYVYLIKQADDQYQVILEVDDAGALRTRRTCGSFTSGRMERTRLMPVRALTKSSSQTRPAIGQPHQPVHQRHVRLRYQAGCRAR